MTAAAIISGSLVDVRNVGVHKSVRLTIHVPAEYAMKVFDAFGWPTNAAPVSVAIAALNEERKVVPTASPGHQRISGHESERPSATQPQPNSTASSAGAEKRRFAEMSPAQQAGMLCQDRAFIRFINEKHDESVTNEFLAADWVRLNCNVKSRKQITPDNAEWSALVLAYRLWQREPEVVPA